MSNEPMQRPRHRGPMAMGIASLALFAGVAAPHVAQAQIDPGANGTVIITDADTPDFSGDTNPIAICVNGQGPTPTEIGSDQFFIEEPAPGPVVVDVYDNDAATCTDPPDRSISVPLTAGGTEAVVIGSEGLATFTYDTDCVDAGTSRVAVFSHAVAITNDDQGGETEASTALDHLGHAVDRDHLFAHAVLGTVTLRSCLKFSHVCFRSA